MTLSKAEKELLRKQKLEQLKAIMSRSKIAIINKINQSIQRPEATQVYWSGRLKEVNAVYDSMNSNWNKWIKAEMDDYYNEAYDLSVQILRRAGLTKENSIKYSGRIIDALINDTIRKFNQSVDGGKGVVNTLFREVQTSVIREDQINAAISEALITEPTVQRIKSNLEKQLTQQLVTEGKILVGSKNWKPEAYAELLARTRTRDAQSSAAVTSALDYGVDLIQVSDHNTTTEICMRYEGQIYSISGRDSRYPQLGEVAPFHPNCLHVMLPLPIANEQDRERLDARAQEIYNRNQQKIGEQNVSA